MRDLLYLDIESDPLGGNSYVDLFNEDLDGDDILCRQQENMERLPQLTKKLGSQNKNFEEKLLAPPVIALVLQPTTRSKLRL